MPDNTKKPRPSKQAIAAEAKANESGMHSLPLPENEQKGNIDENSIELKQWHDFTKDIRSKIKLAIQLKKLFQKKKKKWENEKEKLKVLKKEKAKKKKLAKTQKQVKAYKNDVKNINEQLGSIKKELKEIEKGLETTEV
jgi:hypothetical protein